jgi:pyruvate,water dikinase
MTDASGYVRWFESLRFEDVPVDGGKNASLGEWFRKLGSLGVRVPNGFAFTPRYNRWHILQGFSEGAPR